MKTENAIVVDMEKLHNFFRRAGEEYAIRLHQDGWQILPLTTGQINQRIVSPSGEIRIPGTDVISKMMLLCN